MLTPLEMVLFACYLIYVICPIPTPAWMSSYIDSSLGMLVLFGITVFLFMYCHPLLAVLYVFVVYEMIRRSTQVTGTTSYIQFTPSEAKRERAMKAMNPAPVVSLEEEVISSMAPIPSGTAYMETEFKPLSENIHQASKI